MEAAPEAAVSKPATASDVTILAVSAYPEITAGARVRVVEMGTHLAREGIVVEFEPSMSSADYRRLASPGASARKAAVLARSVVRASRVANRNQDRITLVHRVRSLLPLVRENGPLDIYDFDDAIYLRSTPPAHHERLGALKRQAVRSVRQMRSARLVTVGNQVLADTARQYARTVEIVPSCVDPTLQATRRHADDEFLKLGWIGSISTSNYLKPVLETIGSLYARGVKLRLILMGASQSFAAPWIEHRTWSVEAERAMLTEIDVGLMPLPDDPWARGKCGYKLLRYFAAGLPTIASPVGINSELIARTDGFAASQPGEWASAIRELAGDILAREQLGAAARRFVEREYSFQVWAPRFAELLRGMGQA